MSGDENKKPRRSEVFFAVFAAGDRRAHCVTSTPEVYAIARERAIYGTDFDAFEYGSRFTFCP